MYMSNNMRNTDGNVLITNRTYIIYEILFGNKNLWIIGFQRLTYCMEEPRRGDQLLVQAL